MRGGEGGGEKQHLLTSLEMTYNLLTPSDQLTPKIRKKLRILFFLTLTLGWKNKKRPSGPTELDLEAGNLVCIVVKCPRSSVLCAGKECVYSRGRAINWFCSVSDSDTQGQISRCL